MKISLGVILAILLAIAPSDSAPAQTTGHTVIEFLGAEAGAILGGFAGISFA
jgi:hypothetical protein